MENKGKNKGHDNLIPCKPGETANPNGRPKGQRNFKTLYWEAIKRIAESQNTTPEEFEVKMIEQAVRKGFNGYKGFYADTMDRVHGKAEQKTDITSGGEKLAFAISEAIAKKNDITIAETE